MEIFECLIKLEKKLHSIKVRKSKKQLEALLADGFIEIGSSGKLYDKNKTIDRLTNSKPYEIISSDFKLNIITPEVMQLVYRTKYYINTKEPGNTVRNSIWKKIDGKWQMIFHQGTASNINQPYSNKKSL